MDREPSNRSSQQYRSIPTATRVCLRNGNREAILEGTPLWGEDAVWLVPITGQRNRNNYRSARAMPKSRSSGSRCVVFSYYSSFFSGGLGPPLLKRQGVSFCRIATRMGVGVVSFAGFYMQVPATGRYNSSE